MLYRLPQLFLLDQTRLEPLTHELDPSVFVSVFYSTAAIGLQTMYLVSQLLGHESPVHGFDSSE